MSESGEVYEPNVSEIPLRDKSHKVKEHGREKNPEGGVLVASEWMSIEKMREGKGVIQEPVPVEIVDVREPIPVEIKGIEGIPEGDLPKFLQSLGLEFAKTESRAEDLRYILKKAEGEINKEEEEEPKRILEELREAVSELGSSISLYNLLQREQMRLFEGEISESLRIPKPELLLSQGVFSEKELQELLRNQIIKEKKIQNSQLKKATYEVADESAMYASEIYQNKVRKWFEERLRYLEYNPNSFEEDVSYQRITAALHYFLFRKETSPMAEEIKELIETREIIQRVQRIWNLATPEGIGQQASRITLKDIERMLTFKVGERTVIADEFRNYEALGRHLEEERKRIKPRIEELTNKKKNGTITTNELEELNTLNLEYQGKSIIEYFSRGGEIDFEGRKMFVDEAIRLLEEKAVEAEISDKELEDFQKLKTELWARKIAGRIWSITGRAAHFGVLLNGNGDFYADRIMNLSERLKGRVFGKETEGIWNPEGGQPFNIGFRDFFSNLLDGVEIGVNLEKDGKKIKSLEAVNFGDENIWKKIRGSGKTEKAFSDWIIGFEPADQTRKNFWGPDSFFHNPSLEKFKGLIDDFGHLSETEKSEKWGELLDRILFWMNTRQAHELIEYLDNFTSATRFLWISELFNKGLISRDKRDKFYKKYLGLPVISKLSPKAGAALRMWPETLWGVTKVQKFEIIGSFLANLFKYTFSE